MIDIDKIIEWLKRCEASYRTSSIEKNSQYFLGKADALILAITHIETHLVLNDIKEKREV